MDYEAIGALRDKHAAWRLLRAGNAALILSFLGGFFVEGNRGASPASAVAAALDDELYALNLAHPIAPRHDGDDHHDDRDEEPKVPAGEAGGAEGARYPKTARAYLDDWAGPDAGYLRRFYPTGPGGDEVHYEVTPAFEKAYAWVTSLPGRAFVGTESRLHTVVDLLRQIVHGTEVDPDVRLAELRRRRAEIDGEIAAVESGEMAVLDPSGVRDRYQQLASTARELLADFREVEDNFRRLDRAAREKIAAWDGSKGELLAELIGNRSEISGSDQGRSFQAFYEYLLSHTRQQELTELLAKVQEIDAIEADQRIRGIHHDWSEAAERAQRTVRQISEQLRRFLDDQVWLENRRVLELVREIEATAITLRASPPPVGLEIDLPGVRIALPFERPLYTPPVAAEVDSTIADATEDPDPEALFAQAYVDRLRLLGNIRGALPERSSALLSDIVALHPIEQGAAEIIGYLALDDDEVTVEMDDADEILLEYAAPGDPDAVKRARLPRVTVHRR